MSRSFHSGWLPAVLAVPAVVAALLLADAGEFQPREKSRLAQPVPKPAADAKATREVLAAVNDAVGLLDGPDYRQFFEHYAPVGFLQAIRRQKGGVTGFARRMARDKQAGRDVTGLLDRLRKARKVKPTFNDEKTIAKFVFVLQPARTVTASEFPFGRKPKKTIAVKGFGGDLGGAVNKSVAALEAADFTAYLSHMLPVTELESGDVAEVAKRLKSSPATVKAMIADLKAIANRTPKYEQKGTVAVVTLPTPQTPEKGRKKGVKLPDRVFKFQKVGGHWRLYDNTKAMRAAVVQFRRKIPAVTETLVMEKFRDHWRVAGVGRGDSEVWFEWMWRLRTRSKIEKTR
ncbi:MAG: hypothetical protein ACE5KM_22680 [Planctomycetaceae bacterium]